VQHRERRGANIAYGEQRCNRADPAAALEAKESLTAMLGGLTLGVMEIQTGVLAVRKIGKLTVEELPDGYRVIAPREFNLGILIVLGCWVGLSLLFFGDTWAKRKANAAFYFVFGAAATLLRISMRNVITVKNAEIEVLHKNFGLVWWNNSYNVSNGCELRWMEGMRKSPSALELACEGKKAWFAYEITEAEAVELLRLINSRFPHLRIV
jgi:hypothetical protein